MKTLNFTVGFIAAVLLVILALGYLMNGRTAPAPVVPDNPQATSTDNTISTPEITFTVPDGFGLAVTPEQILVSSYIPPCDSGFEYCLYYTDPRFEGTNFESAGLRINRRTDLDTRNQCLTAQPDGYTGLVPEIRVSNTHATSKFGSIGDAGAGHTASGDLYRLNFDQTCYEFETRIATAQFENYEPGTIREFTRGDRTVLEDRLAGILRDITFASGTQPNF
jgi:hypothetical protein